MNMCRICGFTRLQHPGHQFKRIQSIDKAELTCCRECGKTYGRHHAFKPVEFDPQAVVVVR